MTTKLATNWTMNAAGERNKSELFTTMVVRISRIIRQKSYHIVAGRTNEISQAILDKLSYEGFVFPSGAKLDLFIYTVTQVIRRNALDIVDGRLFTVAESILDRLAWDYHLAPKDNPWPV